MVLWLFDIIWSDLSCCDLWESCLTTSRQLYRPSCRRCPCSDLWSRACIQACNSSHKIGCTVKPVRKNHRGYIKRWTFSRGCLCSNVYWTMFQKNILMLSKRSVLRLWCLLVGVAWVSLIVASHRFYVLQKRMLCHHRSSIREYIQHETNSFHKWQRHTRSWQLIEYLRHFDVSC